MPVLSPALVSGGVVVRGVVVARLVVAPVGVLDLPDGSESLVDLGYGVQPQTADRAPVCACGEPDLRIDLGDSAGSSARSAPTSAELQR